MALLNLLVLNWMEYCINHERVRYAIYENVQSGRGLAAIGSALKYYIFKLL